MSGFASVAAPTMSFNQMNQAAYQPRMVAPAIPQLGQPVQYNPNPLYGQPQPQPMGLTAQTVSIPGQYGMPAQNPEIAKLQAENKELKQAFLELLQKQMSQAQKGSGSMDGKINLKKFPIITSILFIPFGITQGLRLMGGAGGATLGVFLGLVGGAVNGLILGGLYNWIFAKKKDA